MSIYIGGAKQGEFYIGTQRMSQIYVGSTKVYELGPIPYLIFHFTSSVTLTRLNTAFNNHGRWTQLSTYQWKFECSPYYNSSVGDSNYGWARLTSAVNGSSGLVGKLTPSNLGGAYCSIVGYGNLDHPRLINLEAAFYGATALMDIGTLPFASAGNVGNMFNGCTNVTGGAYNTYSYLSALSSIYNHSGTFTTCGSSTTTGAAELAQIPSTWGGTYVPPSYTFTGRSWSSRSYWECIANSGDVLPTRAQILSGLNLFTSASVSSYAGVNMRKTSVQGIYNFNSSAACYYYPAFVQKVPSSSVTWLDWKVITSTYNGMLTANQSSGDMPGTLDPSTFGPFTYESGSYDSTKSYYFVFLVTNSVITSNYDLATCNYGILTNNYFKATMTFNWYI